MAASASSFNATTLRGRNRQCRQNFARMLQQRRGVADHVKKLEAAVETLTDDYWNKGFDRRGAKKRSQQQQSKLKSAALAVLIRGQTYRGNLRDSFHVDRSSAQSRTQAQQLCLESLMTKLIEPYEATGHRVDAFLTVYKDLGGPLSTLLQPLGARVATLSTVQQRTTVTQLLPLGDAVRAFLAWCRAHEQSYDAVVVTRFDLYLKTDLHSLLGDATSIDGFRLLWRESGGHWRHHSDSRTSRMTFKTGPSTRSDRAPDWRNGNPRAPDALLAFPYAYTRCFLSSVRNEFFPLRNETRPLGFMHNMVPGLRRALPFFEGGPVTVGGGLTDSGVSPKGRRLESAAAAPQVVMVPPGMRYLVRGQFDSNPCRASCMLNPIYDLQPRMNWITASNICQSANDFLYDAKSDSLCCPAPNYCCPNSLTNCADPSAILFDAIKTNVTPRAIVDYWPVKQYRPRRWLMTPASVEYVASVWKRHAREMMRNEKGKKGFVAGWLKKQQQQTFQSHEEFLRNPAGNRPRAMIQAAEELKEDVRTAQASRCASPSSPEWDSAYCRGR